MLILLKKILGLTSTEFDDVIQAYIDACWRDLESIGVTVDDTDPLLITTCVMYVRGSFDVENFDTFMMAYDRQKDYLRKCSEYNAEVVLSE